MKKKKDICYDDISKFMCTISTELVTALLDNGFEFFDLDLLGDTLVYVFKVKPGIFDFADGFGYAEFLKQKTSASTDVFELVK